MRDVRHPADWSPLARALLCLAALLLVLLLGWLSYVQPMEAHLAAGEQQERELKAVYEIKIRKAVNLAQLQNRLQRASDDLQMQRRHLAAPGDHNATLTEIASVAQTCGLKLESARPGQIAIDKEYTTHALAIRLSGPYHAFGHFAAGIAAARPILVLSEMQLTALSDGVVAMDAIALSYQRNDASLAQVEP